MTPVTNGRVLFNSIPEGFPELGKTVVYDATETIDLDSVSLDGGVLIKTLELSVDPYMRGQMRDPDTESYIGSSDPFHIGKPTFGCGVGVVLRTENSDVKKSDYIFGFLQHTHYQVLKDVSAHYVFQNPQKLPLSYYLGVLGIPGMSAYMAWKEFAKAKTGETVFVSTGAGSVGSFVVQIAKLEGLKVIGSAGSDEKVQFMKVIGADAAFNYKTTDTAEVLKNEGGIDIYWDNVGGSTLEAALDAAHKHARFIECGMIAGYNATPVPVRNIMLVVAKSLSLHGFVITDLLEKYRAQFYEEVTGWVVDGKIKHKEERWEGLDKVEEALIAVQKGTNMGKAVVHVANEL